MSDQRKHDDELPPTCNYEAALQELLTGISTPESRAHLAWCEIHIFPFDPEYVARRTLH